ncbi:hypothetical protein LTS18_001443, partial [Coniosporium uncinatum]
MRLYEPKDGKISLDGNPYTDLDRKWLRQNITLVEQTSTLFNADVFHNIALGRSGYQNVTLRDVQDAADFALLEQMIRDMPDGYHTDVGAKGGSLSGGQRQRMALARARLRDTPILILDESTSALDYINRSLIMDAIRKWRRGKTTIVITHDISQILLDDFAYILKDGRVVQEGYRKDMQRLKGSPFEIFLASSVESPHDADAEADKSLPPTPKSIHDNNNIRDYVSISSSVYSDDSIWDPLDEYLNLKDEDSIVPTVFSHRVGVSPMRDSMLLPAVVSPFWRVNPPLSMNRTPPGMTADHRQPLNVAALIRKPVENLLDRKDKTEDITTRS